MPSERSRYLNRNRGPTRPFDYSELRAGLVALGADRLANLLLRRAENDEVIMKAITAAVGIGRAGADFDNARKAIDYALHFPDYVRYTEGGHGQILDEIKSALQTIREQEDQRDSSLRLAQYAIQSAEAVAENFEDDWDWTSSLDDLKILLENTNEA